MNLFLLFRYIAYMKNYNATNVVVSFSAERSIQDEINRQSQSDVPTILISYMVMFIYIAFALGQYKVHNNDLRYFMVSEYFFILGRSCMCDLELLELFRRSRKEVRFPMGIFRSGFLEESQPDRYTPCSWAYMYLGRGLYIDEPGSIDFQLTFFFLFS